jgi:YD repeat-containing protein
MPQANFNTPIEPMRRQQQQGGILNALGINLSPERRAGLAAGLSSGSGNKPAGSAFVGSMGAAMQGAEKKGEHEDTEQMKRNQQQFSQTSTAFGDLMKQTQVGNAVQVGNARAKFLEEQAKNLATGGKASAAWQNTPYGRSIVIEGQVQKQADSDRKTMEKQWTLNGTLGPQQEIDKAKMKADSDAMRARLYKQVGLTPEQGAALANTGMEPPYMKGPDGKPMVGADGKKVPNPKFNPFDARHMTDEQFRATVPKGAHYIDTDGQVYTREYDDENQKSRKHDTQKKTEAQPSAGAKAAAVEREADQTSEEED